MSIVWYGIDFIDIALKAEKNQHSDRALILLQKSTLWWCTDILSLWDGSHMYTVWYCIDFIDFYKIMDTVVGQIFFKSKNQQMILQR